MLMASSYRRMKAITLFKKKEVTMNTARLYSRRLMTRILKDQA